MELRTQLDSEFGLELPATTTFDHSTVAALAAFVAAELSQSAHLLPLPPGRMSVSGSEFSWSEEGGSGMAVSVAGVSGRWPGSDAGGVAGFWNMWRQQIDLPQVHSMLPLSTRKSQAASPVLVSGKLYCQHRA